MLDDIGGQFTNQSDIIARVVLHGRLRRKFGPEFTMAASTSARAIGVLCILKPGFRAALMEGEYRVVRGSMKNGADLDERMLHLRLPPSGEMHIWPVAKGGKKGGVGKVIVGAVLVVAAVALSIPTGGGSLAFGTAILGGLTTTGALAMFGTAMILGGITQMLSPQPAGNTSAATKEVDAAQSFLLGGQLNVAQQGIPVPVPYGRIMTGSVVVSVGYEAAEYVPGSTPEAGRFDDPGANFFVALKTPGQVTKTGTGAGGGGKGGGGQAAPHTPVEAPNTLRSRALVRLIDVIGEGPIGGLVNGAQSIYFNDTPLQAPDGSFNFNGVGWSQRFGYPDQDPMPGFPASEETVTVNTQVRAGSPGPITQQIQSSTANGLRLTLRIPSLFNTDTTNGDINPSDIAFTVDIRPSRTGIGGFVGGYVQMLNTSIVGKCTSPYERSYRMELPGLDQGANTWDVRVTRLTPDSDRVSLANDLFFQVMTIVTDHQLMYPDTAYIGLIIDAELFGSNIPTRTYLVDGRMVQVPANYDPPSRTYSPSGLGTSGGTWDTISFKNVSTSNPAWVLYDMLTDSRYGCGIPGTSTETTRADLYVISQYCDGVVGDGFGGTERRYVVNAIITEQVEAYVMLQTMVSAFRGMTHWGAGQVVVTADMPKNPLKLVNQANVIDGDFDYQGTSLKTRHNLVRVTWRDPNRQYTPTPEVVEMTGDIARRGVVAADLTAWGCTTRGLAHRLGKWFLFTENNQIETVQYDASLYHLDMRPGDIFQQEDPLYFGLRYGGRLREQSTRFVLHLDTLVQLTGAPSYTLTVVMPDNTVGGGNQNVNPLNFTTSPDGTYTIVTFQPGYELLQQPMPNAEWILVDSGTQPRLFQTVSVAQPQPGRYQVTAAQYNPGKFDYVEFGVAFPEQVFSHLPALVSAALSPPTNVSAIDYMVGVGATQVIRVTVSWNPPNDIRVDHFQIAAQGDGFAQLYEADGAAKDIDSLVPGVYAFSVRSVSRQGATSVWVSTGDVLVDGKVDPPDAPGGLTVIGGTRRFMISWIPVARRDIKHYEIQRAPYLNGFPTSYATIAFIGGSSFIDGSEILLPHSRWFYRVRAITFTDVAGFFSLDEWGETTLMIVDDLADGIINTAKFAHGLAVPTLSDTVPTAPPQTGDSGMVFVTTTGQLYTWNGVQWSSIADQVAAGTVLVPAGNITGQLTSAQIADLSAAKITGQITGTQIADGSISTPELSTGAVTTAKIAAGAVTTESLSVASASNVIWNACMEQAVDGWNLGATAPVTMLAAGPVKGTSLDPTWRLEGFGTGFIQASRTLATNSSQVLSAFWDPNFVDSGAIGIPFPPNTPCEAQARLILHRCCGRVAILFMDASGANIAGAIAGTRVVTPGPTSGRTLNRYALSWAHGISPPNCARVRLVIQAFNDGGADIEAQTAPPFVFFTQTAIGASVANATQPQAWVPGGMTSITGSMIKSQTIVAAQIQAGAIGATQIAAGAIIAGKISANAVIAGTIQAGAVGASEIAAGQIRATHLASDFLLSNAAQFGTAVIGTAQIQDLTVGTSKLAGNAVTNIAYASSFRASVTSLILSTDGSPVALFLQTGNQDLVQLNTEGSGVTTYRTGVSFYRDSVPWTFQLLDFPGAGSHLYQVVLSADPATGLTFDQWAALGTVGVTQLLAITIKR